MIERLNQGALWDWTQTGSLSSHLSPIIRRVQIYTYSNFDAGSGNQRDSEEDSAAHHNKINICDVGVSYINLLISLDKQ